MAVYLSDESRAAIERADRRRCAYCWTSEANSGVPLTHDHIQPRSKGGRTSLDNVCLACRTCNEFKADAERARDPLTGEDVPLFHPRQHRWKEHFSWSPDGTLIEGLTAIGRATVIALRMNHATIVAARARWCLVGWHPPADE